MYESLITPPSAAPITGGGSPSIDAALAAEGVTGREAEFIKSIYQQESGSGSNTKTSNAGAVGGMQIIPATFRSVADHGWDIQNPEHNLRAGIRYARQGYKESGGDPVLAGAFYYGGPGGMAKARDGVAVSDPRNPNAPNTLQYGAQVVKRMGAAPAASAATVPSDAPYFTPASGGYASLITPPPLARTTLEAAKDVALGAGAGVVQGVEMVASAFGADNAVARGANDISQGMIDMQSPARKQQREQRAAAIQEAEASGSIGSEIAANVGAFTDAPFESTLNAIGTSVPTLMMSLIPGFGQANIARLVAQGVMGAAQGAGAVKGSIYEAVERELTKPGPGALSKDDAKKAAAAAQAYDSQNGGDIALGALLGWAAGSTGIERSLTKILSKEGAEAAASGVAKRAAMGALAEAPMEGMQGGQERFAANRALQNEGVDVPTWQGVAGSAAGEAAASVVPGGVFGAMTPSRPALPPELQPVAEKAAEPNSPLSKAAMAANTPEVVAQREAQRQAAEPAAAPANANTAARLAELESINRDAEEGAGRFFTPEEQAEYKQLTEARDATPGAKPKEADVIGDRAKEIAAAVRESGALDTLRGPDSPVKATDLVKDLATAQSPNTPTAAREQALGRVEFALQWAGIDLAPRAEPVASQESAVQQAAPAAQADPVIAAMSDPKVSAADKTALRDAYNTALNVRLPQATRDQALAQAREIAGRYAAPAATPSAATSEKTPAVLGPIDGAPGTMLAQAERMEEGAFELEAVDFPDEARQLRDQADSLREQAATARAGETGFDLEAEAVGDVSTATNEQNVDGATGGSVESRIPAEPVQLPAARTTPAGDGPAYLRRRKASLRQLIDNGLNRIERRENGFFLSSANGRQEFKLDGMADSQLARAALAESIRDGAEKANVNLSAAQALAGNGKKGRVEFDGLKIGIENYIGSERVDKANSPPKWRTKMALAHYGDVTGTVGADGDGVDVYVVDSPRPGSPAFVIDQYNEDGSFDETKTVLGVASEAEALRVYDAGFSDGSGPDRRGAVTAMPIAEFRAWAFSPAAKKPAGKTPEPTPGAEVEGSMNVKISKDESVDIDLVKELPEVESVARGGRATRISKKQGAVIETIARAFGKEVQFYTGANSTRVGDGFILPGDQRKIYLNATSSMSPIVVFGHELMHQLKRDNPEAHAAIEAVVARRMNRDAAAATYGKLGYTDGQIMEELVSDLGGDLMADKAFWADVMAEVREANGDSAAKKILAQLAEFFYRAIDALTKNLRSYADTGAGSKLVDDMTEIRAAFQTALAGYMQTHGIAKPAMQAEILRAGQEAKRSAARVGQAQAAIKSGVTETPEFKRWFGDSKVVDADGKPLVGRELAVAMYERGASSATVAKAMGDVSVATVKRWVSDAGAQRTASEARGGTQENRAEAVRLYSEGLGAFAIAERLGVSNRGVYNWLRDAGVEIRSLSEAQALRAAQGRQPIRGVRSTVSTKWGEIRTDSVYEAARLRQLETDQEVESVARATESIKWGENQRYTPDFVVTMKDGGVRVEEVKPTFQQDRNDVVAKAEAARESLGSDADYKMVVTEDLASGFVELRDMVGLSFASDADHGRFKRALATAKSATGNSGSFDPNDANITRSADRSDSPEFRRWFGKPGVDSNLVNEDGSPMRLYHGTNKRFTEFRRSKIGAMGPGIYLGDDRSVAEGYAGDGDGRGQVIMEVYARGKYLSNRQWSDYVGKHGWAGAEAAAKADGWSGVRDTQFESAVSVWDPVDIKSATYNTGEFGEGADITRSADRSDALTVEGYHFSKEPRKMLSSLMYGTGLQGSDREAIQRHPDERLRQRISFYVNKGTGVRPESGVGGYAHRATLENVYDSNADVERLKQGRDKRSFESAVLDAGYDGYLDRMEGEQPGQVIMLGRRAIQPELVGQRSFIDNAKPVPAPAEREMDLGDKITANKALPAGKMEPADWKKRLQRMMPAEAAELDGMDVFEGSKAIYKDELVSRIRAAMAPAIASRLRDDPMEVSSRAPWGKTAAEDPVADLLVVGLDSSRAGEKAFEKNVALVREYPNYRPTKSASTTERQAERFIEMSKDNLLWLYDSVPAEIRERSHLWYDGANKIAKTWAPKYNLQPSQIAGVMAVLSPQKDWFMNVDLARRVIDTMDGHSGTRWSAEMTATAQRIFGKPQYADDVAAITGKTLDEVNDLVLKAMWVRAYDETYNDRAHALLSPEGDVMGKVMTQKDAPAKVAWGDLGSISKAVAIIQDDSLANISARLGGEHKVRNFYNNILVPNGANGHVTIDTHAVAAALLRPLSGSSLEVLHNFGGAGSASSAIHGSSGTYGLYAEAYRRAAAERGVLAREMQSITWEAVRGLFTPGFKSQQKNVDMTDGIWENYRKGRLSLENARQQILDAAGGIEEPSWFRSGAGSPTQKGRGDAGVVPGVQLPGRRAGSAAGGAGGSTAEAAAEVSRSAARQTDTPEFKRWFGDSKVVDADGKPLVAYHSTDAEFDSFARTPSAHLGYHFGTASQAKKIGGRNLVEVYLSIKNPLRTIDAGDWSNPYRAWEVLNKKLKGSLDSLMPKMIEQTDRQDRLQLLSDSLQSLGYDGIVYKNRVEGAGDSWVALEPAQIKSATGNNGTFDPASPDIMRSAARDLPKATLADFEERGISRLLGVDNWAILTAENPMGEQAGEKTNAAAMRKLRQRLADMDGVEFRAIRGKYGDNEENSLAVVGITEEQAVELGREFNQDSVLTRKGLIYQDGSINPATGIEVFRNAPDNYYSKIGDTIFRIDIDFDTKINPAQDAAYNQRIDALKELIACLGK